MEHKVYICDPEKAVTCIKSICKHNPNAFGHLCECTLREEWAALDENGKPILCEAGEQFTPPKPDSIV